VFQALIPMSAMMGQAGEEDVFGPDDRVDPLPPPYLNNPQAAYNASKVLALKHAEEYIANEKPDFDVIHIHPSVVLGRDELALTAKDLDRGSNHFALAPVRGENVPTPFPVSICHIDDVAQAHVRALDPEVEGNQSFLLCCTGDEGYEVCYRCDRKFPTTLVTTRFGLLTHAFVTFQWEDIKVYTSKHFPQAVESGLLPNSGTFAGFTLKTDPSKIENLGIKLKSYEDMTVDLIGQYVELLEKEGASERIEVIA
jgi:hypothetical protein